MRKAYADALGRELAAIQTSFEKVRTRKVKDLDTLAPDLASTFKRLKALETKLATAP
jgi:hypothetical protein